MITNHVRRGIDQYKCRRYLAVPAVKRVLFALVISFSFGVFVSDGFSQTLPRAAVFDFELVDTSLEGDTAGKRDDQQKRLILLADTLRKSLAEKGLYEIVDVEPQRAAIAKSPDLHSCNGCAETFATALNADVAIIGHVQKVSNLILNVNVQFKDVKTGRVLRAGSADIRGNTDESWLHGLRWLIKNRLTN